MHYQFGLQRPRRSIRRPIICSTAFAARVAASMGSVSIDHCNQRSEIFCADTDYRFYLEKLQLACGQHGCQIHAYVLMTNHVHLLITPSQNTVYPRLCKCWDVTTSSITITATGVPAACGKAATKPP
ncbi:MAG: transposase [Gammaproteobacteria bacterium]